MAILPQWFEHSRSGWSSHQAPPAEEGNCDRFGRRLTAFSIFRNGKSLTNRAKCFLIRPSGDEIRDHEASKQIGSEVWANQNSNKIFSASPSAPTQPENKSSPKPTHVIGGNDCSCAAIVSRPSVNQSRIWPRRLIMPASAFFFRWAPPIWKRPPPGHVRFIRWR